MGSASRLSRRSSVDLPAPDGPITPVAPSSTATLSPSSTRAPPRTAVTASSSKMSISPLPVRLEATIQQEEAMKYMLLIHQGTTPLPGTDAWNELSPDEQGRVYADYQAINQTPGMTPGERMQDPET